MMFGIDERGQRRFGSTGLPPATTASQKTPKAGCSPPQGSCRGLNVGLAGEMTPRSPAFLARHPGDNEDGRNYLLTLVVVV